MKISLHASLESTCKSRISKIATRCQNGGSIIFHHVQAKSELKNFKWHPGHRQEGTCSQNHIHHSDFISHALLGCTQLKIMVMLNNRNMTIGILMINRTSIITLLNKVPYLSNSRHITEGMWKKHLDYIQLSMGNKPPVCLGTTNTFE